MATMGSNKWLLEPAVDHPAFWSHGRLLHVSSLIYQIYLIYLIILVALIL